MHKHLKRLPLMFALVAMITLITPRSVYASSSLGVADYKPQEHEILPAAFESVFLDPEYAYDWNTGTFADFTYSNVADGFFELKNFTTAPGSSAPPAGSEIAFVDFKVKYYAAAATDDTFRIVYRVGGIGPIVLQDWTSSGKALGTYVWTDQPEPFDQTWSLAEIDDIEFAVEVKMSGTDDANAFELYEAWVTIYYYSHPTVYVDPSSQDVDATFTIDVNVTDVDDLYGWEFKLQYNTTLLTATTVVGNGTGKILQNGQFFVIEKNDTTGLVWASCTLTGDVAGISGDGDLATITFDLDGPTGTSFLNFNYTRLIGRNDTIDRTWYMTHTAVDGQATITAVIPEFPLGVAVEIALAAVIVHIWWKSRKGRPRSTKPPITSKQLVV